MLFSPFGTSSGPVGAVSWLAPPFGLTSTGVFSKLSRSLLCRTTPGAVLHPQPFS